MKRKQNLIIVITSLVLLLMMTSCIKKYCCTDINTVLDLEYKSKQDSNLLNKDSKIVVYYDIDGKKIKTEELMEETRRDKNGYILFNTLDSNGYRLNIFVNNIDIKNNMSITYVQLDDYRIDTIECEHKIENNFHDIGRIWLNGNLMTESYINFKSLTIIK